MKNSDEFWQSLTSNLSRGNNIQEGHYAERSWALLLTYDLPDYQVNALIEHADGVYVNTNSMNGALMQLPKLFLHIGAKATSSTEVLSESLINHVHELKLDGYQLAVHGKYDPTKFDFPNVDREILARGYRLPGRFAARVVSLHGESCRRSPRYDHS